MPEDADTVPQCMTHWREASLFCSTALDTVNSMLVLEGSRLLKYESEAHGRGGSADWRLDLSDSQAMFYSITFKGNLLLH